MSGFGQNTLGFNEALRRSGVKGGQGLSVAGSGLIPVMVMADFSQTYSAQPFEGRAVSGGLTVITPGRRYFGRLHSRAPGGVVIEDVRVTNTGALGAGHSHLARLDEASLPARTETLRALLDSGGVPPRSDWFEGDTAIAPPFGAGPLDLSGLIFGVQPLNARVWVPPGSHLCILGDPLGGQTQTLIVWREIPEPIGLP